MISAIACAEKRASTMLDISTSIISNHMRKQSHARKVLRRRNTMLSNCTHMYAGKEVRRRINTMLDTAIRSNHMLNHML
jgi:hypothetical protein